MGAVYRAFDPELRRHVAIKVLLEGRGGAGGERARTRFAREARATARLRHPAIVSVHEVGEHEGRPFLVMDLVEGEPLDETLKRQTPPPRRLAALVAELARALAHAHDLGIIHSDVKPANVLIDREGRPKLTDFGLARDVDASRDLTVDGQFLGTPAYAAPEQARGDASATGPRSDVYGLGAVLYHALTGRAPFGGSQVLEVLGRVFHEDPEPPRRVDPSIHPDLETIALRCLEKEPERRYPSAGELAADLDRFVAGEAIAARPLGWRDRLRRWVRRNRALAATASVALVVIAGLLVAGIVGVVFAVGRVRHERDAARREREDAEAGRAREAELRSRAEAAEERARAEASAAGAARASAESARSEAERHLSRALVERAERLLSLGRPQEAWALSARAVELDDHGDARMALSRAQAISPRLDWVSPSRPRGAIGALAWSDDGSAVAIGSDDKRVYVYDPQSGRLIVALDGHTGPVRAVALARRRETWWLASGGADRDLRIAEIDAAGRVRATRVTRGHTAAVTGLAFASGGAALVSADAAGSVRLLDLGAADDDGDAADDDDDGVALIGETGQAVGALAVAPDGRLIGVATDSGVRLIAIDGSDRGAIDLPATGPIAFGPATWPLAVGKRDGTVSLWKPRAEREPSSAGYVRVGRLALAASAVTDLAFAGDGTLAVATDEGSVRLADADGWRGGAVPVHAGAVAGLAFAPGAGGQLATIGDDDQLRLFDVDALRRATPEAPPVAMAELGGHAAEVSVVAVSPNGELAAAAEHGSPKRGTRARIRVFAPSSGETLGWLAGHDTRRIGVLAWSPGGALLASGGEDGLVQLWDAKALEHVATLEGHARSVNGLLFLPDGATLVSGEGGAGAIRLWDVRTRAGLPPLDEGGEGNDGVGGLVVSPDGATLFVSRGSGKIEAWRLADRTRIDRRGVQPRGAGILAISGDGARIAVQGPGGTIEVREAGRLRERIAVLEGTDLDLGVNGLAFHPTRPDRLASASGDGLVTLWDVATGATLASLRGHGGSAESVAFTPDGAAILSGSLDGTVRRWSFAPERGSVIAHTGKLSAGAIEWSDAADAIAWCSGAEIVLVDARTSAERHRWTAHERGVMSLAFSPDGALLASAGRGGEVAVWRLRRGESPDELSRMTGHAAEIPGLAWTPDGQTIASGSFDKTARIWAASTGELLRTISSDDGVMDLAFRRRGDGVELVLALARRKLRVVDPETGLDRAVFDVPGQLLFRVAASPDGAMLALATSQGGGKGIVSLRDAETGRELARVSAHAVMALSLAWRPDGGLLASGGPDNTIRVWDPRDLAEVTSLTGHGGGITAITFSGDGAELLSGSADRTIRRWELRALGAPAAELIDEARGATGLRVIGIEAEPLPSRGLVRPRGAR